MKNIVKLLLSGLLMVACVSENKVAQIDIARNCQESYDLNAVLNVDRLMVLEETDSTTIGNIQKVQIYGEEIYVSDGSRLFCYNLEGHLNNVLDCKGRGPGEYLRISDFAVAEDYIYIIDSSKGIYKYDRRGELVGKNLLDKYVASIYPITDKSLLLTSAYQDPGCKFQVVSKASLAPESEFMEINENELTYRHLIGQKNFFVYDGRILFFEPMNNQVYELTEAGVSEYVAFNLFDRNPPKGFLEEKFDSILDFVTTVGEHGYCLGLPIYGESRRNILFRFSEGMDSYMCVYDKKSKTSVQFKSMSLFDGAIELSLNDLVWDMQSESEIALTLTAHMYDQGIQDVLSRLTGKDNVDSPVILICSFK